MFKIVIGIILALAGFTTLSAVRFFSMPNEFLIFPVLIIGIGLDFILNAPLGSFEKDSKPDKKNNSKKETFEPINEDLEKKSDKAPKMLLLKK